MMKAFLERWDWLRIPGVIVVAAWALCLYGTPVGMVALPEKR
jgi:hypothetical protein